MSDLAKFWNLTKAADDDELEIDQAKRRLTRVYDELVLLCPHSEAIDKQSTVRGMGTTRRCKICGIVDRASEGGTPGDEYDWGYPGSPNREFWKDSNVEQASDEKEFDAYRRRHYWEVKDGKPFKRY